MAVREKVALLFTIIVFHAINYTDSLPKHMSTRARPGVKQVLNSTPAPWIKPKTPRNRISKANQQDVCEKFNFPEIQYPSASTPNTPLYFHDFENKFRDTQTLKPQPKHKLDTQRRNRKLKTKHSPQGTKGPEFSSAPSYRDVGTFPDIEYPLNNKDMWRPNFWNCPPKTFSPSTNVTKSRRRGIHAMNTKSIVKTKKHNQVTPTRQSDITKTKYNRNQPEFREDNIRVELPTKKRSHDQITPVEPFFDNSHTATPTPQLQDEIAALRTKLASNLAQKAVSLIKDKLNSKTSSTTEHTFAYISDNDLEDILCLPRNFNSYTLIDSSKINETTVNDSLDIDNTTESVINVFTAFTERPELNNFNQSNAALGTDNTSLLPLNDINTDTPLSPRGSHSKYDTNRSIVEHSDDTSDKRVISYNETTITDKDKVNNESDEDYTTDDPIDSVVLSTISPIDNWRNTDVIDPYRSVSCPDELEEYYLAVN